MGLVARPQDASGCRRSDRAEELSEDLRYVTFSLVVFESEDHLRDSIVLGRAKPSAASLHLKLDPGSIIQTHNAMLQYKVLRHTSVLNISWNIILRLLAEVSHQTHVRFAPS